MKVNYKIGDYIECVCSYGLVPKGARGVIKCFFNNDDTSNSQMIGIEFEVQKRGYHNLHGNIGSSSGYYLPKSNIYLITKVGYSSYKLWG